MKMTKVNYNTDSKNIWKNIWQYIVKNISSLIVFIVVFAVTLLIAFFDVTTSETIQSFSLNEYEIGQIADRTIEAEKTILADEDFPFVIEKGEKIIKKGFSITEDLYLKLTKMAQTPTYIDYRAFGNIILYFMLLSALMFFLYTKTFSEMKLKLNEEIFLGCSFLLIYGVAAFGSRAALFSSPYSLPAIIPATFVVILITILFNQKTAVYFSFITFFDVFVALDEYPVSTYSRSRRL